jgi:hypothetical protein
MVCFKTSWLIHPGDFDTPLIWGLVGHWEISCRYLPCEQASSWRIQYAEDVCCELAFPVAIGFLPCVFSSSFGKHEPAFFCPVQ